MDITKYNFKATALLTLAATFLITTAFTITTAAKPVTLPPAIKAVSSNADAAIIIPSLADLNKKIAMLNEKLTLQNPMMNDVLTLTKMMNGLQAGIDDQGALLLVITDIATAIEQETKPNAIILIPITDYDLFIGQLGGDPIQPVTDVIFKNKSSFAKQIDGFAVISENKAAVENYQPSGGKHIATTAGTVGRQAISTGDVMLIIDFSQFAPALQSKLAEKTTNIEQQIRDEMAKNQNAPASPQLVDMLVAIVKAYIKTADTLLNDTAISVISMDISEQGLGISLAAQFKQDTTTSQIFTTGTGSQALLDKLAVQPYLIATSFSVEGINTSLLIEKFKENLPEQCNENLEPLIDSYKKVIALTKGTAQVQSMPPGGLMAIAAGAPILSIVESTDGPAMRKEFKNLMKAFGDINIDLGQVPGQDGMPIDMKMSFDVNYIDNAMQIDGLEVDHITLKFNLPQALIQQMGPGGMMMMQQFNYYLAVSGNDLIVVQGPNPQAISTGLAGLKDGQKLGQIPGISQIRPHLTDDPMMEFFIDTHTIAQAANPLLGMFLGLPPVDIPESLPPIGSSITIEDHGLVTRTFIPMEIAVFVKDTVTTIQEAQQNAQQQWQQDPGQQQQQPGPNPAPF